VVSLSKSILCICLCAFLFYACEEVDISKINTESKTDQTLLTQQPVFTGPDLNGAEKTCSDQYPEQVCTMEFTPSDIYALNCEREGNMAIACGCHDWICIIPEQLAQEELTQYGLDIMGEESSCTPMSEKGDLVCTEVFTEQDQFAIDCEESGDRPIQCGCHQFLCAKD
jgi:hypothetical protein